MKSVKATLLCKERYPLAGACPEVELIRNKLLKQIYIRINSRLAGLLDWHLYH